MTGPFAAVECKLAGDNLHVYWAAECDETFRSAPPSLIRAPIEATVGTLIVLDEKFVVLPVTAEGNIVA